MKDGKVQISNNLCKQRMKPVKLNLKNCQNIGSKNAAENKAFVFSLTESCRLNGINPETYLERLFKCIVNKETYDKQQLLLC
ncbi:MAG: transposase domain-containing protein [Bacteroidota bacterium]|nr:transposase domain-containing protein [Bacteroidota bacterium]